MFRFAAIALLAFSCSASDHPNEVVLQDGADGQPCIPQQVEGGMNWECPTGDYFFPVAGANDPQTPGIGGDCSFRLSENTYIISCPNQPPVIRPVDELFGSKGDKGDKGDKGEPGSVVKVWEDEAKCLWIQIGDGKPFKIRYAL